MTAPGSALVTGAGGFVAGHIAAGLAAMGWEVTGLDRSFDALARARLAGVRLIEADLAGPLPALPTARVILHGAALTTGPAALGITAAAHVAANTRPLLAMLDHAARARPEAFVYLSSSGVFGEGDGSPDLCDTDPATAQGPYSAAKRAGEALVPGALGDLCQTHVLRLGYLYGPAEVARPSRQRVSLLQQWVEAAMAGGPLVVAASDPRRDWTFAPDLAGAIARIVTGPGRVTPVHLCAPEAPRDSVVAALIAVRWPGVRVQTGPAQTLKAPMQASRLPVLDGFGWTGIAAGLDALAAAMVPA